MVHSLAMKFAIVDGVFTIEAAWGVFLGASWCEAYDAAVASRPRP